MKRIALVILGLLALFTTAQAASFNCAKAQTKVEKIICIDAELSKLDEELNAAYKSALLDEKQADSVKQVQKQWMKTRNICLDAECVKNAYSIRINELTPSSPSTVLDDNNAVQQPRPLAETQPDFTQYFFGNIANRKVVLMLVIQHDMLTRLPSYPTDYNVHGKLFYIDGNAELVRYIQGRWWPSTGVIGLEEYRLECHSGKGQSDEGYCERKDQTGFLGGEFRKLAGEVTAYEIAGAWIKTSKLTHYEWLSNKISATNSVAFKLKEGGTTKLPSGNFNCYTKSGALKLSANDGSVNSFSWDVEETAPSRPLCSFNATNILREKGQFSTRLVSKGKTDIPSRCTISIVSLDTQMFVAVDSEFCPCDGSVLIDTNSHECRELKLSHSP